MTRLLTLGLFTLALSACDAQDMGGSYDAAMVETSAGFAESKMQADSSAGSAEANTAVDIPQFMAYRYNYGYVLPAKSVASTANSHMQICLDAGPAKCEVLNSGTQSRTDENVSAHLTIRGEPKWLEDYKVQIGESVAKAKGKLENSSIDAEDLTRAILDTDARLNAKKGLRTRLENLLETRDAELKDLLELERELSRVQGEIESITSNLKVLRKRVSKSIVHVNYGSKSRVMDGGTFSPVTNALKGFVRNFAWALGGVITFIAAILPWLVLVIIPLAWFGRWLWRRFRTDQENSKARS